jgi:hypothetical protein
MRFARDMARCARVRREGVREKFCIFGNVHKKKAIVL